MGEQAIFTAIPGGRLDDGRLRVTVFVTPKLTPAVAGDEQALVEFEAFRDWPRTLRDARWELDVAGVGTFPGSPLDDPIEPDRALWHALFGGTRVGEAGFQHFEQSVVHSYPVEEVVRAITTLYADAATQFPTAFPPVTTSILKDAQQELSSPGLEQGRGDRRAILRDYLRRYRKLSDPSGGGRYFHIGAVSPSERPRAALAAAVGFYDRAVDPHDPANPTAPVPPPVKPEFHSFAARCADFPELMRHLGLAIDLWIDDPGVTERTTTIRVVAGLNVDPLERLLAPDEARPFTLLHYSDRFWAPAPRRERGDILDGSLALDDVERFLLEQVDPDGMALKTSQLLDSLARTDAVLSSSPANALGMPSMTADASSLPALRSTGLIVARRNRAKELVAQFEESADHERERTVAMRPATLDATDVTRGWRIDVYDRDSATGDWQSLHERVGEYELVAPGASPEPLPVQPKPDEGYLKAASTSSEAPDPAADQYLHETLAGWDGWSLAVKRPGRPQTETGTTPADAEPDVADTGFPLAARFRVKGGTLPRLRFGRSYRVRVRAVDLSGHSIPSKQLDERHERDLDGPYLRWEPVPAPAVVPLTEYTEGESLMRMVIRSTLGESVDSYIALPRVAGLAGHEPSGRIGIVYREDNERHLAAPLTSVQLAETHGVFDAALAGDPAQVAAQFAIAAKEAGSYLTLPGARLANPAPRPPGEEFTFAKDDALRDGEVLVHDVPELPLPYLPDVLSRGISFTTLPGDGGTTGNPATRLLRWPGDPAAWHDRLPVRIRVIEGDGAPFFDADRRTLTVPLPKATLTTVRVSSFLDERDVDLLRVWELIASHPQGGGPTWLQAARARVRDGLHWMTTPWAELTLVHAVEKPLEKPVFALNSEQKRQRKDTFSVLPGFLDNHAASTGRIDIEADWSDPVDDLSLPEPTTATRNTHVADFLVTPTESHARIGRTAMGPAGPYGPRHVVRHEFGDTHHHWVDYRAIATTRFREYFPPEITNDRSLIEHPGDVLRVDVPSSRRPDPPDVRSIIPTWEWQESRLEVDAPFAVRRVRTGGGLRVYLGRPWYSSGADELLGVVLRVQPWLTSVVDVERGVAGSLAARGIADAWAATVLAELGVPFEEVAAATSASSFLVDKLTEAAETSANATSPESAAPAYGVVEGLRVTGAGGRIVLDPGRAFSARGEELPILAARARPRDDVERFLLGAAAAVEEARAIDLSPALREAAVAATLAEWLDVFALRTSPEGRRFTSSWGVDPVFRGEALPAGPYVHQFALRTAVGYSVTLAEMAGVDGTSSDPVTVVGHEPHFDRERGLWYCDLQIDAGSAYTPFVQLALARYQPHSIPGEEISAVSMADFVQVLPRREASYIVAPDETALTISLAGAVGVPEFAASLSGIANQVAASRFVEAWIERLPAGSDSDLDWERVGGVVTLSLVRARTRIAILRPRYGNVEWAGVVGMPERVDGERYRVRLAEYELHAADQKGLLQLAALRKARRIVYADTVDLP
ncbi:hypothetical protein ET445_00325 [Agromyces protaetiae]|uniref:Uncharacterized protein n=1 Tax=Agromyces protaetiae TaxID=2509455 RepID=A0A4P6F8D6_9MICO|nr:hypothetical protein [Agromyces protaetiae]QAY72004.1 hypothetical protein ET445_00325 [Agromyces protaetiae]